MARRKITAPKIDDHTVDSVEENSQEIAQVDNTQVEETSQVEDAQVEENIDQVEETSTPDAENTPDTDATPNADDTPENTPDDDSDEQEYITLDQVAAYDPASIDAAIVEIETNHDTVNKMVGKLPDEAIASMRDVLSITDDIEADKQSVRDKMGGIVASLIDDLKSGEQWERVSEYASMLNLVDRINETRSKIGLPILSIKIGGRMSGASSSMSGNISPRRSGGYMLPGVIDGTYSKCKVKFIATEENILVTVNDAKCYTGKQGTMSLSMILNEHILPACGASPGARMGFPKFLRDNGFDPDKIMLHAPPTVKVEE